MIENKGVQLLLEALKNVDARAVIVGFGDYRASLEKQAEGMPVLFTGPLEHRHLVHLLALADAAVVPSIFPEAFGMVAAEAAAAGCPPIVADHSGLAEIAQGLEEDYPPKLRQLASFPSKDVSVLTERLNETLALGESDRAALRPLRGKRRSSAGAGRAWRTGCWPRPARPRPWPPRAEQFRASACAGRSRAGRRRRRPRRR